MKTSKKEKKEKKENRRVKERQINVNGNDKHKM
jgi:hypothetical protein